MPSLQGLRRSAELVLGSLAWLWAGAMDGRYRLCAKDFGPIREAEVEIRPLTVFVGPSNTGKSYLAGLLYALHRALQPFRTDLRGSSIIGPRNWQSRSISEELHQVVLSWRMDSDAEEPGSSGRTLLPYVHGVLNESWDLGPVFAGEVARCFGVEDPAALVRHSSDSMAPSMELHVPQAEGQGARFRTAIAFDAPPSVDVGMALECVPSHRMREFHEEIQAVSDEIGGGRRLHLTEEMFAHMVFRTAFEPIVEHGAFYLPADRTGVMHSHHVVVSALLQRASLAGIRRFDDVPVLSGVMADFLDVLVSHISQLEGRQGGGRGMPELAQSVESRILNGRVLVNTGEVGYPAFSYRPAGWSQDLPLMRASSMVSELAPVVLYLRHVVRKGDLLIIEEPESHLHPAKQTMFARELATIVNAGVRVVMTTHSEWFLEQIGNLVRAAELPTGRRSSHDEVLKADDVGAWLFQDGGSKGSTVTEIKVDPGTGLFPTDYGPVSDALYNEHAAISNALEGEADQ